jgi:hypothetical protein
MELIDRCELLKKLFPYEIIDKKTYSINAKAVYDAIMAMEEKNREIKNLCEDCIHNKVCYPKLNAPNGQTLLLTYCYFREVRESE